MLLTATRRTGGPVTVIGDAAPFTNGRLAHVGDAALGLAVLGGSDRLVWLTPAPTTAASPGDQRSFVALVPGRVLWTLLQVVLAVVLLAGWRGRRLGPVVSERLPVAVRAAESVEGRGRLYRRARARGRAADTLRTGVRARVLPALGLPAGAPPAAVVDDVAARSGQPPAEVGDLLYGAAPPDDATLVRLADDLDRLMGTVLPPERRAP